MISASKNYLIVSRKEHKCDGCGRTFPKGTIMEHIDLKDTILKTWSVSYLCPTCQKIIPHDGREYTVGEYYEEAVAYDFGFELNKEV